MAVDGQAGEGNASRHGVIAPSHAGAVERHCVRMGQAAVGRTTGIPIDWEALRVAELAKAVPPREPTPFDFAMAGTSA